MNKKIITVLSLSAFLFAACGSDDSSSANDNEKSSSSVAVEECDEDDCDEELDEKSSSSKKVDGKSSDSKSEGTNSSGAESEGLSSSSVEKDGGNSSSVTNDKSSSSVAIDPSAVIKGEFTDGRDGKVYKTVKLGYQTWMAENLNVNVSGSLCYSNEDGNCEKYGRLYTWTAAKEACPVGWHLPSQEEFNFFLTIVKSRDSLRVAGWDSWGFLSFLRILFTIAIYFNGEIKFALGYCGINENFCLTFDE